MQRGNAFHNRKKRAQRQPQQQRSSTTLALDETSSKYIAQLGRVTAILSDVDNNLDALRWFAISEGLVNDAVRAKAWPLLLGLTRSEVQQIPSLSELVKEHKDTDQVAKDVDRSLIHFMEGRRKGERRRLRRELSLIINAALCRNAQLNYFQGYHDIATVFLLVSRSEKMALLLLERLSRTSIRYLSSRCLFFLRCSFFFFLLFIGLLLFHHVVTVFILSSLHSFLYNDIQRYFTGAMEKTLEPVVQVLSLLFPLLSVIDPSTHQFLQHSGVEPYFALSWVLTWYSHDVHRWEVITRLFDAFLASHPLLPLYLAAVLVCHRREGLLACKCEYSAVHNYLTKMEDDLPWERLLRLSFVLLQRVPPYKLLRLSRTTLDKNSPFLIYPHTLSPSRTGKLDQRWPLLSSSSLLLPSAPKTYLSLDAYTISFFILFIAVLTTVYLSFF